MFLKTILNFIVYSITSCGEAPEATGVTIIYINNKILRYVVGYISILVFFTIGLVIMLYGLLSPNFKPNSSKTEKENEKGFYKTYTRVVDRVTEFVLGVNPNFKYPHMLIYTIIEGAHHQRYFSKHLPALTDCEEGKNNIVEFYKKLVTDTLKR